MKEALIRYIEQYVQLLPEEWDMLWQRAKPFSVPKETVLQHHGSVCDVLHFVNEGVVRHEHHSPTKHGVVWFSVEGELATDVYSFLSRKTGTQSLIACSPVQGWVMDYQALQTLYNLSKNWERFGRLSSQEYIFKLAERTHFMQFQSAQEKYEDLLRRKPDLIQHVNLQHIASYLGIAQETLSRIRARR